MKSANYNLDNEMTKQELQIENRFIRSKLSQLSDYLVQLDLDIKNQPSVSKNIDMILSYINDIHREIKATGIHKDLIQRAIDRGSI